jgi:hypothetical protein
MLLPVIHNITNYSSITTKNNTIPWCNMPTKTTIEPQISTEWAQSLIGLSMKVPENWWVGCKGFKLHDGKVDSFDIQSQKWNLLLDDRD